MQNGHILHSTFRELPKFLRRGDLLVLNETRVIPARLFGRRATGGRVEVLVLHPAGSLRYDAHAKTWIALVKPGRRVRANDRIDFENFGFARIVAEREDGQREIEFDLRIPFEQFLNEAGTMPLPPYVHEDSEETRQGYQTVFAREPGSVAAPTASLHFTDRVFAELSEARVRLAKIVLDVGLGTFRPMKSDRIDQHLMESEHYHVPEETAQAIGDARARGARVVAAGTTVVRALESCAAKYGHVVACDEETALFITPGFTFRVVDVLLTNFHLPKSTLLVLVSAFAGGEAVRRAYREAIERQYRFYSFGDAMLVEKRLVGAGDHEEEHGN